MCMCMIAHSCLNQCTYCKTKHARGELGSYPPEQLVARAKQAFEGTDCVECLLQAGASEANIKCYVNLFYIFIALFDPQIHCIIIHSGGLILHRRWIYTGWEVQKTIASAANDSLGFLQDRVLDQDTLQRCSTCCPASRPKAAKPSWAGAISSLRHWNLPLSSAENFSSFDSSSNVPTASLVAFTDIFRIMS